jgi:hypothetical protein
VSISREGSLLIPTVDSALPALAPSSPGSRKA